MNNKAETVMGLGRKLDLTGLTDDEAEHVLQVVQRDMKLRRTEEERLSELRQELDEEVSRSLLLSRQALFNQRCCIRCCSPFTFLLRPRRQCRDCRYNVCKACCVYSKQDGAWICSACQKRRLLNTQSLEWFYTNVKHRFKRFGSAKVLKTLYKKHLAEHGALSELTEGSAYEDSLCNEGSICGSDSTFYRQSEEHSMAETLTVALRVAKETIDEAISKAEIDNENTAKQNEAHYLREHKGQLIEELAKTIVRKIIRRRKSLHEMRQQYDEDWPPDHQRPPSSYDTQATLPYSQAYGDLDPQAGLWRSHSAFSILDNDPPELNSDVSQLRDLQGLKKEGAGSAMSTWKSVDRLDNSMLKSPDGNWIALQSAQLSRPSLLTKRKSLVYSALERESGVVSAYEGMSSDNDKLEFDSSWGAVLQEIHRKMRGSSNDLLQDAPEMHGGERRGSRGGLFSDSEGNAKPHKLLALFKRKVPQEIRRPLSSRRTSIIDVNFNPEESSGADELDMREARRSRRKRKSRKREHVLPSSSVLDSNSMLVGEPMKMCSEQRDNLSQQASNPATPDTLTSGATTPEPADFESEASSVTGGQTMNQELISRLQQLADQVSSSHPSTSEEDDYPDDQSDSDEVRDERRGGSWQGDQNEHADSSGTEDDDDNEGECRRGEGKAEDDIHVMEGVPAVVSLREGEGEGEEEEEDGGEENCLGCEERTERLTCQLRVLESQVRANQFSSTEDELDRIGLGEGEREEREELGWKLCRLTQQVNATQYSSTEDELDGLGRAEEATERDEEVDEGILWKREKQVHRLTCLVSACQFSSTEDELDRVGEREQGGRREEVNSGEVEVAREEPQFYAESRSESIGDLDLKMFDVAFEAVLDKLEQPDGNVDETQGDDVQAALTKELLDSREKTEDVTSEVETEKLREVETEKEAVETQERASKSDFCAEKMEDNVSERMVIQSTATEFQEESIVDGTVMVEEGKAEEQETGESTRRTPTWGRPQSDEEDTEFDRIISSMLMLSMDEMYVNKEMERPAEMRSKEPEEKNGNKNDSTVSETVQSEEMIGRTDDSELQAIKSEHHETYQRAQPKERTLPDRVTNVDEPKWVHKQNVEVEAKEEKTLKEVVEEERSRKEEEMEGTREEIQTKEPVRKWEGDVWESGKEPAEEMEKETTMRKEDSLEEEATDQEGILSPQEIQNDRDQAVLKTVHFISTVIVQRYSAVSLRSITTEVLKVLNTTEELLQGVEGREDSSTQASILSLPPGADPKKMDQQFSRMEENVYVAAGTVYSLEAELSDLEECARGVSNATSDKELSFLEEQVASAAAKVQQSELQISDISARIAALKNAGLNVDTQPRFTKAKAVPIMPITLDSTRQLRRRLPAPPMKGKKI